MHDRQILVLENFFLASFGLRPGQGIGKMYFSKAKIRVSSWILVGVEMEHQEWLDIYNNYGQYTFIISDHQANTSKITI